MLRVAIRSRESKDLHRGHGGKAENTEKEREILRPHPQAQNDGVKAKAKAKSRRDAGATNGAPTLRTDTVGSQGESRCGAIQMREINVAATEA
jgi:hypothetical protein